MKREEIPPMSSDDRDCAIERMQRHICESHLDHAGGYPFDWDIIGDEMVVAETDDFKAGERTSLGRYPISELLTWHDEAVQFLDDCSDIADWDFDQACHETRPANIGTDHHLRYTSEAPE